MTYHFPKLRALDIRSHHQQGQSYYVLRDPQQVTDQPLLVPQAFGPLLALCDGTNDLTQLVARFQRYTALAVDHAFVQEFVQALDEAFLLESDRYRVAHQQASAEFRSAPYRQAALAGLSYPKASHDLWQHLQDYLEGAESVETLPIDWSYPVGILSPHIDYQRGGPVYAQVWKRAAQAAREAELVILLGTDHYGSDPFTLTRQNYATPYGTLPTARNCRRTRCCNWRNGCVRRRIAPPR
ncbi:MAG: AmmeMemoRadiSam system protein B [Caldilineaceae bacterium]